LFQLKTRKEQCFKKAGEPSPPLRPQTFPAILTDAGKVSKVALGVNESVDFTLRLSTLFAPLREMPRRNNATR
jgi:hypothetical protein